MKQLFLIAALVGLVSAVPADARTARRHHHAAAANNPASVTIDGKDYKVCAGAVQDDCVNPRQAGLNFGNRPTQHYDPAKAEAETPPSH